MSLENYTNMIPYDELMYNEAPPESYPEVRAEAGVEVHRQYSPLEYSYAWDLTAIIRMNNKGLDVEGVRKADIQKDETYELAEVGLLEDCREYYKSLLKFAPTLKLDRIEIFRREDYDFNIPFNKQVPFRVSHESEIFPFRSAYAKR